MDNHLLEVLNDKIILEILIQVSPHLPHMQANPGVHPLQVSFSVGSLIVGKSPQVNVDFQEEPWRGVSLLE